MQFLGPSRVVRGWISAPISTWVQARYLEQEGLFFKCCGSIAVLLFRLGLSLILDNLLFLRMEFGFGSWFMADHSGWLRAYHGDWVPFG